MIYSKFNKFNNLKEMNKSLETNNLPRLHDGDIENLSRQIIAKGIEAVIKNLPTNKKPRTKWFYW